MSIYLNIHANGLGMVSAIIKLKINTMKNQIEIVKEVAEGMIGIGGVPSNKEFYDEFNMRIRAALNIPSVNTRIFKVGEKVTWRGMNLFVAEVGKNELLLATDMNTDAEDYNDWWVNSAYVC